ncbi:MAG: inositol monophosphatase family protein [Bacteroidales bacterium]|nr:inositol monophosphatase family protein [Bacteroidales bacterium]
MKQYRKLCLLVCDVARDAGQFIREELPLLSRSDVQSKGLHSYVTYVDTNAEKRIVKALQELLPEAGFIVEEESIQKKGGAYQWVVDPLDGTTNFIHGLPCFSVSIALMRGQEVVLGVVYEVMRNECFYAWKGGGAYLNDDVIRVSEVTKLSGSLLATGFPYHDYSLLDKYMELFTWCLRNSHGVRRIGSAAVDLAYVACGRFEGFFEYGLNAWDVAAGSLIVGEAGGKVTDFKGSDRFVFGKEILATNAGIYTELHHKVKELFH